MEKKAGYYSYYMDNTLLTKWDVTQLLSKNYEAASLLRKSNNCSMASYFFGVAGSACVGVSLGLGFISNGMMIRVNF